MEESIQTPPESSPTHGPSIKGLKGSFTNPLAYPQALLDQRRDRNTTGSEATWTDSKKCEGQQTGKAPSSSCCTWLTQTPPHPRAGEESGLSQSTQFCQS